MELRTLTEQNMYIRNRDELLHKLVPELYKYKYIYNVCVYLCVYIHIVYIWNLISIFPRRLYCHNCTNARLLYVKAMEELFAIELRIAFKLSSAIGNCRIMV